MCTHTEQFASYHSWSCLRTTTNSSTHTWSKDSIFNQQVACCTLFNKCSHKLATFYFLLVFIIIIFVIIYAHQWLHNYYNTYFRAIKRSNVPELPPQLNLTTSSEHTLVDRDYIIAYSGTIAVIPEDLSVSTPLCLHLITQSRHIFSQNNQGLCYLFSVPSTNVGKVFYPWKL